MMLSHLAQMKPYELGLLNDPSVVPFLMRYVAEGTFEDRMRAVEVLGLLSEEWPDACLEAETVLIEAFRDPAPKLRYQALKTLSKLPNLSEAVLLALRRRSEHEEKIHIKVLIDRILKDVHCGIYRAESQTFGIVSERIEAPILIKRKALPSANLDLAWDRRAKFALWMMEHTNKPLFITGKAGTGKSTLLKAFRAQTQKKVAVVAPTGLAAINVNGQTIHSFFRFPSRMITGDQIKKLYGNKIIKKLDTLVIDEVSMVRADVMDAIHLSLQLNRKSNALFGGVQVIMFGDLFQLPPVVSTAEQEMMEMLYPNPYFFSANVFQKTKPVCIELTKVHRQKEADFLSILNQVREDNLQPIILQKLNEQVIPAGFRSNTHLILTTVNAKAQRINESRLEEIPQPLFTYEAEVKGDFNERDFPTEAALKLKRGARVMFLRNDADGRWVNGTIGTVVQLGKELIRVEVEGQAVDVEREEWDHYRYFFNAASDQIETESVGKFVQYPLKLAYAITIHKSQGQTFDEVLLDLDRGAFAHGQTYVALSRCRTLEGVKLVRPVREQDILFDEEIYQFRSVCEDGAVAYQDLAQAFKNAKKLLGEGKTAVHVAALTQLPLSEVHKLMG